MLFPEKTGGYRTITGKHRAARKGSTSYCVDLLLTTSGAVDPAIPQQSGMR